MKNRELGGSRSARAEIFIQEASRNPHTRSAVDSAKSSKFLRYFRSEFDDDASGSSRVCAATRSYY